MATQKDGGLVSRAVREALGTLVSPQVYGQLLTRSLRASGLTEIPETGAALAEWVEGSLAREIESAVGIDAAELVAQQLAPIVAHASAAPVRSRQPSVRAPAKPTSRPARSPAPPRGGTPPPLPSKRPSERGKRSDPSAAQARNSDFGSAHAHERNTGTSRKPEPAAQARRDAFASDLPTGLLVQAPPEQEERRDLVRTAKVKLTREQMEKLQENDNGGPAHTSRPGPSLPVGHTSRPQASDPSQLESHGPARVLAASSASSAIKALRAILDGKAEVIQIGDLVGLLDVVEGGELVEPIVLLDCGRPTVHVTSIAAIGADLPLNTTIVLWGGSDELWKQIDRDRIPSCRWVRCSSEATMDDVGSLCAMLIGNRRG